MRPDSWIHYGIVPTGRWALAAYRGMWQAFAQAGLTANADDPRLARYATGNGLNTLKSGLSSYKNKGRILKGKLVAAPLIARAQVPRVAGSCSWGSSRASDTDFPHGCAVSRTRVQGSLNTSTLFSGHYA
jgi:hypothetical protein